MGKIHFNVIWLLVALTLLVAACNGDAEADLEATVAASLRATQTAMPTDTPAPTNTAVPTNTPTPTNTPVPTDTPTPEPTDTAVPTNTPEPTLTPTPEANVVQTPLESGDILYELPQQGFSFTLPPDWIVLDVVSEDFSDALAAVGEQNESLSFFTTEYGQSLVAAGIQFYALNADIASLRSGNPVSINVITEEVPFELTPEQYAAIVVGQLESVFDLEGSVEQMTVTIGDEEASRISYTVQLVNAAGVPIENLNTQYIFMRDGVVYAVTVSVATELVDEYLQSAREAAETFRFLPPRSEG